MSFLGLSDSAPSRGSDYLLDDEEEAPRSYGRFIVILLLLALGGGVAWQWHRGGYPFDQGQQNASVTPSPAPAPSAPAPENPTPTAPANNAPAQPSEPAKTEAAPAADNQPKTEAAPAEGEAKTPEPAAAPEKAAPEAEKTPAAPEKSVKPPAARPKPAPAVEPTVSAGEALFAQGQKYLYGKGVPENCSLALKSFQAAADRSHVQAQSTLGVMYFTGHCVTRDLPAAYRWFAKALHDDPSNPRLEQNLRSVWNQMTPEEKQAATRTE